MSTNTNSQGGVNRGAFAALVISSFEHYKDSWLSLIMTLGIPIGFLMFFSLLYFTGNATPTTTIAMGEVDERINVEIGRLDSDVLILLPVDKSPMVAVLEGMVGIGIDQEENDRIVVYSSRINIALATTIKALLEKHVSAELKVEVEIVGDDSKFRLAFFPGALIMSLMNLALFTTGAKVLHDRSTGVLRIYRLLPVPGYVIYGSEITSKLLLGVAQSVLFILLGNFLLDLNLGFFEVVWATFVAVLSSISLLAMGFAVGGLLKSYTSGVHLFTILNLTMIFLGDLLFYSSQIGALRPISFFIPTTHCVDLLRQAMLGYDPNFHPLVGVSYLVGFTLFFGFIAIKKFRYVAEQ